MVKMGKNVLAHGNRECSSNTAFVRTPLDGDTFCTTQSHRLVTNRNIIQRRLIQIQNVAENGVTFTFIFLSNPGVMLIFDVRIVVLFWFI